MRVLAVRAAASVLAVVALVAGVVLARGWAVEGLRARPCCAIAFGDIDCQPPPGMSREAFLGEVQYESELPDRWSLLEPDALQRLYRAFGRHGWVERVGSVVVTPSRRVRVELTYRVGVLAVPQPDQVRVVDRHGVLLPRAAESAGLPRYQGEVGPAAGRAGSRWDDVSIVGAARTAGL